MIIAVDFDGTLCEHKFPNIGAANERLIKNLRLLRSFGHQLILWTCRNQYYANLAVEWCKRSGLEFDAVNDDVPAIK
jgi:hydroxymethylpyrimidine pyrophosphatase-like HAD family hydrolase